MESIKLHLLELELKKYKKHDLQKKMDIATNVFEKISTHSFKNCVDHTNLIEKTSSLTGVNADILRQIYKIEDVSRRFEEWSRERYALTSSNNLHGAIRKHLQESYTTDREIPTKSAILNIFKQKDKPEVQLILNKFFTTIQLPETDYSLIVEKPDIVLRRYQYLHKKIMYVQAEKKFVYIEDIAFLTNLKMVRPENDATNRFVLAVSPESGYISSIYCSRTNEMHLKHWMIDEVIPKLPPGSVVVIQDNIFDDVCDPPGSYATKPEMVDWLLKKEIPHDSNAHRAELLALIEKYKERKERRKIEEILQLNGHPSLFRDKGVNFEYFEPFWKKLNLILDLKTETRVFYYSTSKKRIPYRAKKIATLIQNEYWQVLEKLLLDLEVDAYRKDLEMEEVIDKLMTFAKYEKLELAESELDDYCKAAGKEYIFYYKTITKMRLNS